MNNLEPNNGLTKEGISIVIAYYKGENFIFKCIDSILESHEVSFFAFRLQLIIVIDSLEDAEYIQNRLENVYNCIDLMIIKNTQNMGVAKSRNIGLKKIKYSYYTIIDQDDWVSKEYFSVLKNNLLSDVSMFLLNGLIFYKNLNFGVKIYYFKPTLSFKSIIIKHIIIYTPGLVIFNNKFIDSSSLFPDVSTEFKGCDDWASYLNIFLNSNLITKFIKEPIFIYCLHNSNYSNNIEEMILSSRAVLNYIKSRDLNDDYGEKNKLINLAIEHNSFFFAKDVLKLNKFNLFLNYKFSFVYHYFLSFFNRARFNRIIFLIYLFIYKSFRRKESYKF